MRMTMIGLAALVATLAAIEPALAQSKTARRPWCRQPPGLGSILDCTYHNQQQCLAMVSGRGGGCIPNPAIEWDRREQQQRRQNPNQNWQWR